MDTDCPAPMSCIHAYETTHNSYPDIKFIGMSTMESYKDEWEMRGVAFMLKLYTFE